MTDKQKLIYNMYLQASSLGVGHPFKLRKNFDGFEDTNAEDYMCILKLEKIFSDLPGLNIYDYFAAPYKQYGQQLDMKLDLKWYLGFKAMKAYKMTFYTQFEHNTLSNEETKNDIVSDFDKIASAIRENKITLREILKSDDDVIPPKWVDMYYKHYISDWFIIAFRLIGKDLIEGLNPMFKTGIISEDHIDFIEKNCGILESPLRSSDKLFLTNQIRKLVDAENARKKS